MSNSEEVLLCKLNTEAMVEEDDELPPPVVTRTRSGRQVRTPVAFQDSQVHSIQKTPSRRTRKPVNQSENTEDPTIAALLPRNVHASETSGPESAPVLFIDLEDTPNSVVNIPLEDVTVSKMDFAISKSDHEESCNRHTVIETPPKQSMIYRKITHSEATEKQNPVIPLGKPKSGRVWKDRNKQRFSALLRDKPLCTSWEKKMEAKRDKELVKKYSLQLKEDKAKAKEEKRKRREETLKRRADNERKAEVVQVIRNPTKIKRMKKKQLRKIEKRDTLALLQKSQLKPQKATGKVIEN